MKNESWIVIGVVIVAVIIGMYFSSQKTSKQQPLSDKGNAPCFYIFKTKSDYSGLLTVRFEQGKLTGIPVIDIKKLSQSYYHTTYGCTGDFVRGTVVSSLTYDGFNPPDHELIKKSIIDIEPFVEVHRCKNTTNPVYGYTYDKEELERIVDNNELISRCQKIK